MRHPAILDVVWQMSLRVIPLELAAANEFVRRHHRHHKPAQGHRFSIGCIDNSGELHGAAIVGRPTSGIDPARILEVVRMCSDGHDNACSILYGAAARAGKALGFEIIQTYIFESEDGASLKASGWRYIRPAHPSGRHRARSDGAARSREHIEKQKTLWQRVLNEPRGEFAHHRRDAQKARAWQGILEL